MFFFLDGPAEDEAASHGLEAGTDPERADLDGWGWEVGRDDVEVD